MNCPSLGAKRHCAPLFCSDHTPVEYSPIVPRVCGSLFTVGLKSLPIGGRPAFQISSIFEVSLCLEKNYYIHTIRRRQ